MNLKRIKGLRFFIQNATNNGSLLIIAAIVAIITANSRFADHYHQLWQTEISIGLKMTTLGWINDALMALFFLGVGMEVKRELVAGYLSQPRQRILPLAAATGGVLLPIAIYSFINRLHPDYLNGWAIPGATDIAFTLSILSMFAKAIPLSLRVFITALAIIDDLMAISIIAFFYSNHIAVGYLLAAALIAIVLFYYSDSRYYSLKITLIAGSCMWYCVYSSGVHATISGVILGLLIPIIAKNGDLPLLRLERFITPLNYVVILPLFAFANSGISLTSMDWHALLHPITLGIALGLFFGKQMGIMLAAFVLRSLQMLELPAHTTWGQFYTASILCGIGFTMSLFIASISFMHHAVLMQQAQLGIFMGSLTSATVGIILLKNICRK